MIKTEKEEGIFTMDYHELEEAMAGLIGGVPHPTANLANASALIWETLPDLNWAGFYLEEEDGKGGRQLVLGPFQGRPACIEIPWGRGVCGTAAAAGKTQLVPDVHLFPGHIACDAASASEIVVPLKREDGSVFGVMDLDSPIRGRFTDEDRDGLERIARLIEREMRGAF